MRMTCSSKQTYLRLLSLLDPQNEAKRKGYVGYSQNEIILRHLFFSGDTKIGPSFGEPKT